MLKKAVILAPQKSVNLNYSSPYAVGNLTISLKTPQKVTIQNTMIL